MPDRRSITEIRIAALKRYFMWYIMSSSLDLICVTEYPKCGASWLCQILSKYYDIPFPRNKSPKFEKCIMHGHLLPRSNVNNQVCFVRDGRDVVISFYHHMLFGNNKMSIHSVKKYRKKMPFADYDDIFGNLPQFMHYLFEPNPIYPRFSWARFVDSMLTGNHFFVKYEDMLLDATGTSAAVIRHITGEPVDEERLRQICDSFSFKKQRQKESAKEKSYLRKGIAGDWKNHFSKESAQIFDQLAGKQLIRLGYEKDKNWIHQVTK